MLLRSFKLDLRRLLAAAVLLVSCGPARPRLVDLAVPEPQAPAPGSVAPRILIIGLDGADLRVVDQLVAQDRLPHIAALMQRGAVSRLETVANASPIVWTSIATGVVPEKHGITDFRKDGVPANTTFRTRPALWNILSHYGHSVGILSWWATFPAEAVDGYLVSPFIVLMPPRGTETRVGELWARGDERKTYPATLQHEIADLIYAEEDVDVSTVAELYADAERTTNTRWALAKDRSYYDIALHQMHRHPVETVAVYFQGIDAASHDFDRHVHGRNINRKREPIVSEEEVRAAWQRIVAMYEYSDRLIGGLIANADESTDIIVCSDHGWNYDGTSHWNNDPGLFIAAGPGFAGQRDVEGLSVLDITPIVLTLLGVPLSRQFDGHVPEGLLRGHDENETLWLDDYPIDAVALPDDTSTDTPANEIMLKRLKNLGYLGGTV